MPVEDEVDLRKPLSDAQIDKLHKQADHLERSAEKAERAAQQIMNANKRAGGGDILGVSSGMGYQKGYKPEKGEYDPTTSISAIPNAPKGGAGGLGGAMGILGQQEKESERQGYRRSGEGQSATGLQQMTPEVIKAHQAAAMQAIQAIKEKQKEIMLKQREHDQHLQHIQQNIAGGFGKVQEGFSFAANPVGYGMRKGLQALGKLTVWGAIAAMVIQQVQGLYQQVIEQIKAMYQPGGILDVRKEQLDSLRQVGSLSSIIDMEQGRVFFTSNTGELLRQGVPQATNTEGRVNGYKQYLQEYER